MSFGFTKAQQKQFADRLAALRKADREMQEAVMAYNEIVADAHGTLTGAVEEFEDKCSSLQDFLSEIVDDVTEKIDARSEAWQESDRGAVVAQWLSDLNDQLDTVGRMEQEIEEPEEVDLDVGGLDEVDDLGMAPEDFG